MSTNYRDDAPSIVGAPGSTTAPQRTIYTAETYASDLSRKIAAEHPPTRIVPVTFVGVQRHISVGGTRYGLPAGYLSREMEHDPIAFVLSPSGSVHVLVAEGELVGLTTAIIASIRKRYFPNT